MSLTAKELEQILESAGVTRDGGKRERQRRAPRVARRVAVTITPPNAGPEELVSTTAINFSSRGLCLMHPRVMQRGEQFMLHLPRPNQPPTRILCTVAYCRRMPGGQYSIGAEFTCIYREPTAGLSGDEAEQARRIRESVLAG